MYSALQDKSDFIVLDDPISSFDSNKRFAILNMLFTGEKSLMNRTVLMLTHDFNTIIDITYVLWKSIGGIRPQCTFMTTKNGILSEKPISKDDIGSFVQIAEKHIKDESSDVLNRLIYLRRLLEVQGKKGNYAYQIISNLLHRRENPAYVKESKEATHSMSTEELEMGMSEIKSYVKDFDYSKEYQKTMNIDTMKTLYANSHSNYEKLQLYRIMFASDDKKDTNDNSVVNKVVEKFIKETFHVENDLYFT